MSRFSRLVNARAAPGQTPTPDPHGQEPAAQSPDNKESSPHTTRQITPVGAPVGTPAVTPAPTGAITPVTTLANTGANTPVDITGEAPREASRASTQYLDATHTASEQRVYSVMYRETISRGTRERHFGPKELCEKTGIRSDRTIRTALDGLISKLSVEIVSQYNGSPLGPRYRVFEPREIVSRRKAAGIEIDPQSKKILTPVATPANTPSTTGAVTRDKIYRGTGADTTGVTGVEIAGASNKYRNHIVGDDQSAAGSSSILTSGADDEAYALLLSRLREAVREVTGRESTSAERERWGELAELLITELKIAAGRTGSVSSVPAFLTEHLRRRLWKKEGRQLEEGNPGSGASGTEVKVDASKCPDCFGTGMYYPDGFENGVARCPHSKLSARGEN